ncbi:hypothetical protein [Vibrio diabolicus]|uniref:hypothetical protein n=1 Tax=Vibrio diabolicus TaxID=50719 RepID=UPI00211B1794|nr:hypothetical protein [Vibrio diabolicus]
MKLYFLVEGISSEMQVYPKWIKHHLPTLPHFLNFDDFKNSESGCFFFSGQGYPSILSHVKNALHDIVADGSVDYFFVVLDSDEDSIASRQAEVQQCLDEFGAIPERLHVTIVVQERCFETMLLGNRNALPRHPSSEPLISYYRYYKALDDDPQLMGNYNEDYTHSQFHAAYAIKALRQRGLRYTKANCSPVADPKYFEKICERVAQRGDLKCLVPLIETLEEIANKLK